jgi:nucleoside-diphosphate-sugar epimerase
MNRVNIRMVRIFNTYGPRMHPFDGRVVSNFIRQALVGDDITLYGDGQQTRSFCYIDDCVEGLHRLMRSDHEHPLNLGQDRMVTINELADIIARGAGLEVELVHVPGPQGVRGRNSDNTRLREALGWEPEISLEDGLSRTYAWIEEQVRRRMEREASAPPATPVATAQRSA